MSDEDLRRELARVLRRNKQLKDSSSLALIELDTRGRIVGWNRQAEVVFGWPAAEILGEHFAAIVPPQARAHVDAIFEALASGQIRHSRNLNVRKDGALITCQWFNSVLADEDGSIYLIYCEVRDVTEEETLRRDQQLMQALSDRSPLGIFAKDLRGRYVYANQAFAQVLGRAPAEVLGLDDTTLFGAEIAADLRRHDEAVLASPTPLTREDAGVGPSATRLFWTLKFPLRDDSGDPTAICGLINDITDLRRSELERATLHRQVIDAQARALEELSTPLIPVAAGVLVMPLIGSIDSARAARITETLLTEISRLRARFVILDVTGVPTVDTHVADTLLGSARAVRLLGAEAILTGVRPEVSQTLVDLGIDLSQLRTLGTLQSGVAYAMGRISRR